MPPRIFEQLTLALPPLFAQIVQAQMVLASSIGPRRKVATQHLSTGVLTPTGKTLTVEGADGQRAGVVEYSVSGPLASPWSATSTSYRCIANPVQRMGTQASGGTAGACDGAYSEDWNAYSATHPGALGQPYVAGDTVWAQAWYRDPAASKSSGLSNGIEFYVQP